MGFNNSIDSLKLVRGACLDERCDMAIGDQLTENAERRRPI